MKVHYETPFINVKFTSVEGDALAIINREFGGDILELTTEKKISEPAGSFSMSLVARDNYRNFFKLKKQKKANAYNIFRPMSLVDIYINEKEVMLGILDGIQRSVSMGADGKPIRRINLFGRDLGAFLIEHKIWSDYYIASGRIYNFAMAKAMEFSGILGGQPPAELMKMAVNNWLIKVINQKLPGFDNQFQFADTERIWDKLIAMPETDKNYEVTQVTEIKSAAGEVEAGNGEVLGTVNGPGALSKITYGDFYPMNLTLFSGFQGDLFSFMKTMVSSPFNELYVETGDSEVVLGNVRDYDKNIKGWNSTKEFNGYNQINLVEDAPYGLGNVRYGQRKFPMEKGKCYVVFRPTPYDDTYLGIEPIDYPSLLAMQDLLNFDIDDSKIVKKDLKMSRNNRPSFYRVKPVNMILTGEMAKAFGSAEYDEEALRRYGWNPMEFGLDSYDGGTNNHNEGGLTDITINFQKKLKSWFQNSDKQLTGEFTIGGNSEIRVGNKLTYNKLAGQIENEYEEGYYYITGVKQFYKYSDKFETIITVDRGINKKLINMDKKT